MSSRLKCPLRPCRMSLGHIRRCQVRIRLAHLGRSREGAMLAAYPLTGKSRESGAPRSEYVEAGSTDVHEFNSTHCERHRKRTGNAYWKTVYMYVICVVVFCCGPSRRDRQVWAPQAVSHRSALPTLCDCVSGGRHRRVYTYERG